MSQKADAPPLFLVFSVDQCESLKAKGYPPIAEIKVRDDVPVWLFPNAAREHYCQTDHEIQIGTAIRSNRKSEAFLQAEIQKVRRGGKWLEEGAGVGDGRRQASTVAALIEQARQNPLKWLVPNVVLEDGVHVIHGSEESFKTMLTLQLHEVLTVGGKFLLRDVKGGLKTGIVELEMKNRQFGNRLAKFFPGDAPDIRVLPDALRQKVLSGRTPKDRIKIIADWAESEGLQFVSIDSAVKLFPPGCDLSSADTASDVFSQLQRLPTVWIIAHDRKPLPGVAGKAGNAEIVGSGRFAQDPDVIHQMIRPDGRAPRVDFHWGKMRDGEKFDPIGLYFDHASYRLIPLHPYLHLLEPGAISATELIVEAERRYGWRERRAGDYLASLGQLVDADGNPCVTETMRGHSKLYELRGVPVSVDIPGELVQGCNKSGGLRWGSAYPMNRLCLTLSPMHSRGQRLIRETCVYAAKVRCFPLVFVGPSTPTAGTPCALLEVTTGRDLCVGDDCSPPHKKALTVIRH